jgi:N-acetylglucosaminyldiphosphoundecaprenol N-acetyl-beta-D-mannosaminyltransferase
MLSSAAAPRVAVIGVVIDNVTIGDVLDSIEDFIRCGDFHQIATANTDFLVRAINDDELREILSRCDMVVPDGMPLIWASRLMGSPLKARVAGVDIVPQVTKLSQTKGYRLFLLGGSDSSLQGTRQWMSENYPGAVVCGSYSPNYKSLEEMDHEEILSRINEAKPDILLVAFGNPKQEKWLSMHRSQLKVPVCIGVGGSFDFLAGRVRRAPLWMQRNGLEWLSRMIQEPGRLTMRYARDAWGLMMHLPYQCFLYNKQRKRASKGGGFYIRSCSKGVIVHATGDLNGKELRAFEERSLETIAAGINLVVDLSRLGNLGADMLGSLMKLLQASQFARTDLWLTGLSNERKKLLKSSRVFHRFQKACTINEALRRMEPNTVAWNDEEAAFAFNDVPGGSDRLQESVAALHRPVRKPPQSILGQRLLHTCSHSGISVAEPWG